MIINQREDILWGDMGATYMYGTRLQFWKDGHISLSNPLLAPGEVLKSWFSSSNYQGSRSQPSLPLLKGNHRYQFTMNMTCYPENSIYIKLVFLDRYEEVLEEKVEETLSFSFVYPEDAYTYRVSLIAAGFESLDFYSFSIKEYDRV